MNCLYCGERVELAVHHNDRGYWVGYQCECGWHWRRSERFRLESEAEGELAVMKMEKNGWEMN